MKAERENKNATDSNSAHPTQNAIAAMASKKHNMTKNAGSSLAHWFFVSATKMQQHSQQIPEKKSSSDDLTFVILGVLIAEI